MSNNVFNMEDHTAEFSTADIQENTALSGISYIPPLFFIPLIACKDSSFAKFHANQALLSLLAILALGICGAIVRGIFGLLGIIPFIGVIFNFIGGLCSIVFGLAGFAFVCAGMVNAFLGKAKKLPIIGDFTILK